MNNIKVRGNSIYTVVDGPSWTEAEANSNKLDGNLVTINDNYEKRPNKKRNTTKLEYFQRNG